MDFDLENPLTMSEDSQNGTVEALFANESDHMPSSRSLFISDDDDDVDDLRFFLRRRAFSLISQVIHSNGPIRTFLSLQFLFPFFSFLMNLLFNSGTVLLQC